MKKTIEDKNCLDWVIIKANDCVRDGFWKYYNSDEGIETLVKLLVGRYLVICPDKKEKK